MRVAVTKELGMKAVTEMGKEASPTTYTIEASGIQTQKDVREVIRQLQIIECQMVEIKESKAFCGENKTLAIKAGANVCSSTKQ